MELKGEVTVYKNSELILRPHFDILPDEKVAYCIYGRLYSCSKVKNNNYLFLPSKKDNIPENILDIAEIKTEHIFTPVSWDFCCFCTLPDGNVAIGLSTGIIKIFSIKEEVAKFQAHNLSIDQLIVLPNNRLLSYDGGNKIKIWELKSYKCLIELNHDFSIGECLFENNKIYSNSGKLLYIWDSDTYKLIQKLQNTDNICSYLVLGDKIICGNKESITVWEKDKIISSIKTGYVDRIILLPNKEFLTEGKELRLWKFDFSDFKILDRKSDIPIKCAILMKDDGIGLSFRDNTFGILK